MDDLKTQIADCLQRLVDGKISWDHLIEEFDRHRDSTTREIIEVVEVMSRKYGRFRRTVDLADEDRREIESIILRLKKGD